MYTPQQIRRGIDDSTQAGRVVAPWNALPPNVKAATSVDVFKIRYDAAISELAKMT